LQISLVINTYEQPDYLERVLRGVSGQRLQPAEVLLADDGSGVETKEVFATWSRGQPFRCEHAWQEHSGFRRSRILNQAIARARGDYVVFLDGDTIPHPLFLMDHSELGVRGYFVQGHRALIEEKAAPDFGWHAFAADRRRALLTAQLRGLKHAFRWPFPLVKVRTDLRGVRGCNLAIWREDLLKVNGYNEEFEGWGREDSELVIRLLNNGIQRRDVRGRALCYHLWHPPASRAGLNRNDELLEAAQQMRSMRCARGVSQYMEGVCD
jgi:glycosyltransferase involved in cell wall biosynthesis